MPATVSSLLDLIDLLSSRSPSFVGIDGDAGAGKSALAMQLEVAFPWKRIDLDDYREATRDGYVAALRMQSLASDLGVWRDRGPVVVAGCCLLDVAGRLGLTFDLLVYVRAATEDRCGTTTLAANGAELLAPLSSRPSPLADEIRAYHRQWRPGELADITYLRKP